MWRPRALRGYAQAAEAIYPLAAQLKPVTNSPRSVGAHVRSSPPGSPTPILRDRVRFMHIGGPAGTPRCVLALRAATTPARAWPLVVAMHGRSGNGGAFLWSWVREARTRGLTLTAPPPRPDWSLTAPRSTAQPHHMVDRCHDLTIRRALLTGGARRHLHQSGAAQESFTHGALVAAVSEPMMMSLAILPVCAACACRALTRTG